MNRIFQLILTSLCLFGCSEVNIKDHSNSSSSGYGTLALALSSNSEIVVKSNNAVDLSDFSVAISNSFGEVLHHFENYSDVPQKLDLQNGVYKIVARNNVMEGAGFDTPLLYGEALTNIELGKTTNQTVVCRIRQSMVTLYFSEELKNTITSLSAIISGEYTSIGGLNGQKAILDYGIEDEGRKGWISEPSNGQLTVYLSGINANTGLPVTITTYLNDVKNAESRTLNCDIKVSGTLGLTFEIVDNLTVLPDVDVWVPDDDNIVDGGGDTAGDDDPPVITGYAFGSEGNTSSFDVDRDIEFRVSEHSVLDLLMKSSKGIDKLLLTIESEALKELLVEIGINGEIDFANPDTDAMWYSMFADPMIGLLDVDNPIKGKTEHIFSVGGLMSLLAAVAQDGQTHNFHLKVVDANGEVQKTLTIVLYTL